MIWNFLSVLLPFLFVLTVVVFIHELGHFLVARWCGVKVQTFSIGFGREIFAFNDRHGTRWRLAWIPLGGYVKFIDDENGASVPARDALNRMSPEERQGAFQGKSLGQRAAIVAAGPIANFLLAIVIFAGIFSVVGLQIIVPRVDEVVADGPAARAGFRAGDVIVAIDGRATESFQDVQQIVSVSADRPLTIEVERDAGRVTLTATPVWAERPDGFGGKHRMGDLGIRRIAPALVNEVVAGGPAAQAGFQAGDLIVAIDGKSINSFLEMQQLVSSRANQVVRFEVMRGNDRLALEAIPDRRERTAKDGSKSYTGAIGVLGGGWQPQDIRFERYGPLEAIGLGIQRTHFVVSQTFGYLKDVIVGNQSADQLGGPIRIAEVSGQVAKTGFVPLLNLTAILSVSIGLLNLFPIPLLDGGHLLFYLMEAIRRKPLSERTQEIGFRIGLSLVLMLMIYATFNDLPIVRKWIGLG